MRKESIIWGLVTANVVLAATLGVRGIRPNEARAQAVRPEPGKYLMIAGSSQIGSSIVFFLDTANRRIGAIAPDAREQINVMPPLALDPIFDAAATGAGGPRVSPDVQRNNNNRSRTNAVQPR